MDIPSEYYLGWIVGILEGEGCFGVRKSKGHRYPRISVTMTDSDVLDRLGEMLGSKVRGPYTTKNHHHKPYFRIDISGEPALKIMKLVRGYLGKRRRERVEEILKEFLK